MTDECPLHERSLGTGLEEIQHAVRWAVALAPPWVDPQMLDLGLTEALTNALVHGSLRLSSDGRAQNLAGYLEEVERRSEAPRSSTRPLTMNVDVHDEEVGIRLHWRGTPCPAELRTPTLTDPLAGSGLGTGIIHTVFDEVLWGDDGLSLELSLRRRSETP